MPEIQKKEKSLKKPKDFNKSQDPVKMNLQIDDDDLDISQGNVSAIDPESMFQGNLLPQNYFQSKNSKTMTQRHSNIEKIRRTSRISNNSFVAT